MGGWVVHQSPTRYLPMGHRVGGHHQQQMPRSAVVIEEEVKEARNDLELQGTQSLLLVQHHTDAPVLYRPPEFVDFADARHRGHYDWTDVVHCVIERPIFQIRKLYARCSLTRHHRGRLDSHVLDLASQGQQPIRHTRHLNTDTFLNGGVVETTFLHTFRHLANERSAWR